MKTFWVLDPSSSSSTSDRWDAAAPVKAETPHDAARQVPALWRTSECLEHSARHLNSRGWLPSSTVGAMPRAALEDPARHAQEPRLLRDSSTVWKSSIVLVSESRDGEGARAFELSVSVRVAFDVKEAPAQ